MKKCIIFSLFLSDGAYRIKNGEDEFLDMLFYIFNDGPFWTNCVKKTLLDASEKGIYGNRAIVEKKHDTVLIMPQFVDEPEEYAIEIDKNVLLGLIDKWLELASKKTPEIYFIRYDDGKIEIQDHLPAE